MGGSNGGKKLRGSVAIERQAARNSMDGKDRYIEEVARRLYSPTCRVSDKLPVSVVVGGGGFTLWWSGYIVLSRFNEVVQKHTCRGLVTWLHRLLAGVVPKAHFCRCFWLFFRKARYRRFRLVQNFFPSWRRLSSAPRTRSASPPPPPSIHVVLSAPW